MNSNNIEELREIIERKIIHYIDRDYVFLDMPYHPNVGDSLIALAGTSLLENSGQRCLYRSSMFTFDDRDIPSSVLIVFNGGGNFGDLWKPYTTDFRNKIIKRYPNNHFLILPQSVYYKDSNNLKDDIQLFSTCGNNMTICARDRASYMFLKDNFKENNIELVPDLAFYTDKKFLIRKNPTGKILFLKRTDKELVDTPKYDVVPSNAEIRDWPTMEKYSEIYKKYYRIKRRIEKCWYPKYLLYLEDYLWQKIVLPYNRRNGISFVNNYDTIYTTRLHVAITAVLLGKEVYFFDNSYGKNSALYNTWLTDFPNIKLL